MRKSEKNVILIEAAGWNDEKLRDEYYITVFETLGSTSQLMEEAGFDEIDIKEQKALEKWTNEKVAILEELCKKRGIELWN